MSRKSDAIHWLAFIFFTLAILSGLAIMLTSDAPEVKGIGEKTALQFSTQKEEKENSDSNI
jgi:hypothetical protein